MKKKLILLSSLFAILSGVVATSIVIARDVDSKAIQSSPMMYTMTLDKDHQMFDYQQVEENKATAKVRTDKGSEIPIALSTNNLRGDDYFIKLFKDSYLEFSVPLNGLIKMNYKIDFNLTVEVGYKYETPLQFSDVIATSGTTEGTYEFADLVKDYGVPPSFLRLRAPDEVTEGFFIFSLKLYYTCEDAGDPTEQLGTWSYQKNEDMEDSITITGFNMGSTPVPDNRVLVVPIKIGTSTVTRIEQDVLNNVAWVEHVYLPFIGGSKFLNMGDTYSYNFGSIFGKNSVHIRYQPIQQYEEGKTNVWFIPKALKKISITGCSYESPDHTEERFLPAYAFYGCSSMIKEIEFRCQIDRIKKYAFANCSALENLYLPSETRFVDENVFAGCTSLFIRTLTGQIDLYFDMTGANPNYCKFSTGYIATYVYNDVVYDLCKDYDGTHLYLNAVGVANNYVEKVDIPHSIEIDGTSYNVEMITNRAFEGQSQLRTVILPTISFGCHYMFKDCYRATFYFLDSTPVFPTDWNMGAGVDYENYAGEEGVEGNLHYFKMNDGRCFDRTVENEPGMMIDFNTMITVDECCYFSTFAFENNQDIAAIAIPKNVVLPSYVFANCTNLVDVYFEGTHSEWNSVMAYYKTGVNLFYNTGVSVIHVQNGAGGYIDIPLYE